MPTARCQKNPDKNWPSHALCRAPEKALTRAISLEHMAAGFPVHLAPLVLPRSKQSYHLCTRPSQRQTQEVQGHLRTRLLRVDHTKVGIKPKLNPRDGVTKEEDRKSFHQLYKLQIKSPWSARKTLHLWNIWVDNECSHKWKLSISGSCGFWGQAHAGTGPDQSQSGPHRAHSRSRGQPRGRGGPLGEAEVGCGSQHVQGHSQQTPRET